MNKLYFIPVLLAGLSWFFASQTALDATTPLDIWYGIASMFTGTFALLSVFFVHESR